MSPSRSETFFQRYIVGESELTVYWGTSGDLMAFVVLDPTNGLSPFASFRIQAGPNGNVGILTTPKGDVVLCAGGIAEIHDDRVVCDTVTMTVAQLNLYLDSPDFDLSVSGIKSYIQT
jgi:hypothetical protein